MPTVVIFAGHDHDTWETMGAKGVRTNLEKDGVFEEFDSNYAIAVQVVALLRKHSKLKVLFPQEGKKKMSLKQRVDYANAHDADFMMDIHSNASASRTATGAAAFYWYSSASSKRAALLYAALLKKHGLPVWNGGTYASNPTDGWSGFYMLKNTKMPGILLENFFFTTRSDLEKYLLNPAVQKTMMEIGANTILEYFGEPTIHSAHTVQTPLPIGQQVLREGSSGPVVQYAQSRLNKKGAALIIDGHFGGLTKNAVLNFQRANGLVADGIIGAATWAALEREESAQKPKEEAKHVDNNKIPEKLVEQFELAKSNNITDGSRPNEHATRAEVAVMVYRGYALKSGQPIDKETFSSMLEKAIALEITDGSRLSDFATRAESAVMVYRGTQL